MLLKEDFIRHKLKHHLPKISASVSPQKYRKIVSFAKNYESKINNYRIKDLERAVPNYSLVHKSVFFNDSSTYRLLDG